ncbi:hypothetical protein Pan216_55800 [Planctomycetes bacterium Pan216]|uniref:Uncharacterized protein n=1 Tax=Kolteria novifilia TaxID=2527975 RepID=A0A518BCK1_9BACT|nr:hypothetical protein Pan216_55800 [Planctomycetes bacterium Pan216]
MDNIIHLISRHFVTPAEGADSEAAFYEGELPSWDRYVRNHRPKLDDVPNAWDQGHVPESKEAANHRGQSFSGLTKHPQLQRGFD